MKGVYILLLKVNNDSLIKIGSLNKIIFEKGLYAYVGSAQNNLEKRINRHLRKDKKLHWHIDYLTINENVKPVKTLYKKAGKEWECRTAKQLSKSNKPIKNFGCTDCKCESHLFKIKSIKELDKLGFKQL